MMRCQSLQNRKDEFDTVHANTGNTALFCNTGLLPKYCLMDMTNNMIDIETTSALKGNSSFYEFKKEHNSGDSPTVLSVLLNQQGEDVVYCEDPASRNESGSAMLVHFESMTTIKYEYKGHFSPPVVTISVREPVIIDDNAIIVCRILPLTRDTQILWLISNGTFSKTIHSNDKYQVSTSTSINSSILTIYSVQNEDELKYSCQAINFRQTGRSKEVRFNATVCKSQFDNTGISVHHEVCYNPGITPSNQLLSTNPTRTSSIISIRNLTTLKLSSTSKYITISSSAKGASTTISVTSPTTKSSTILTNIKSVNTTITKYSIFHSSVTIPGRNTSPAVSSTGNSATPIPTVKTIGSTDPTVSQITKTPTASLCDKASSSSFEAIRSKEEAYFQKLVIIATCAIVFVELVIIALLILLVRFCGNGNKMMKCLESSNDNEIKINITSARSGNTTFYAYEMNKEHRAPSRFALTTNQGDKDVEYCENTNKRNESGNTVSVHFNNGAIAFELKSVCENQNCTGVVCEPCYNSPPVVKISVKEPVVMDDNVTLTCHITSLTDDTKIMWFVQNETFLIAINNNDKYKVTTSKSQQLSNLTITSVRHEDEMNYTCKATNFIQTGKSYPMHLSVFENPIVNVSKIIAAKAGTNTTIWCEVPTSSKVTGISWMKNGRVIQITNSTKYGGGTISSPSLEISNVQQVEEGNYTCLATNPIGTGNQTVFLAIVLDPIANISSESVILGNNITVSCYVHLSIKETKITWLKNDKIIQIKGNEKYDAGTFSYEIYHVQLEDEGHYTCQASSPIGIVTSQPVSLSVITSTNITSWQQILKDGVIINITRNRKYGGGTVSSPSLQIYHLRLADEGNYTCQATNIIDIGRSQPVFLTVNLDVTKETSSLHTSGAHIFSSYPLYSTETFESSKTTYLSSYESPKRTLTSTQILQSFSKIPVPTASVKHIEPTYFVQTSATTLYNIHPSSTSLTLQANSDNRTNVNAWIITTVIICIVEAIVITLVVYIRCKEKCNLIQIIVCKEISPIG
ncbi:HMCN [Mytilus edulis]|uniref:HMCN n=1 Tax=Mytilus edulis TaxID=6550 RepID=A0A8S3TBY7_MYTED|nr:HMCN [Mytilus edulis]